MKPTVPDSDVVKKGEHWYPQTDLTKGGWMIAGFKDKTLAECSMKNLNYAFEQGWRAREEQMRRSLSLEVGETR